MYTVCCYLQLIMMNVLMMVILDAIQDAIAHINFVITTSVALVILLQIAVSLNESKCTYVGHVHMLVQCIVPIIYS